MNNHNDEMLRVLLDLNRGLNTIERTAISTDKKVSQMHTILLSKLSPNTTNHVIVPNVRPGRSLHFWNGSHRGMAAIAR